MKAAKSATADPHLEADSEAVLAHLVHGTSLDPETYRRIRARAEAITARLRQQYGEINVAVDLIRGIRNHQ